MGFFYKQASKQFSNFLYKLLKIMNKLMTSKNSLDKEKDIKMKLDQMMNENTVQQKLNKLWILLIVTVCILFTTLSHKIYEFRSLDNIKQGDIPKFLIKCLFYSLIYIALDRIIHSALDKQIEKHFISENYKQPQLRKKRSVTVVKYIIGLIYYLIMVIFGYQLLKQQNVVPNWLGGDGSCSNVYNQIPYINNPSYFLQLFLSISFGKHFARLVLHCIKPQGNFYSYLLHHILSVFLILFCYSLNLWTSGLLILVIHDSTDVANSFLRIYMNYRNKNKIIEILLYVLFPFIWIGMRNLIFPACAIMPAINQLLLVEGSLIKSQHPQVVNALYLPCVFAVFMLISLQILHIIWTTALINYYIVEIKAKMSKQKIG